MNENLKDTKELAQLAAVSGWPQTEVLKIVDKYLNANLSYLDENEYCSNCGDDVCPHTHLVDKLKNLKEDLLKIPLAACH